MTPDKIANQLRQDASAYSEGFADGYRLGKKALVTCKDCKYWPYQLLPYSENTTADPTYPHCFDFKSDGYCSLGKRK